MASQIAFTNLETTTLIAYHAITGLMSKKKIARQTAEEEESAEAVTPPIDRRKRHVDGIKKTIISSILGIASGVICYQFLKQPEHENFSYLILLLAFYIQKPIYISLGMDANQFTWKDWFYIAFMTTILWFVSWTLLLTPCQ